MLNATAHSLDSPFFIKSEYYQRIEDLLDNNQIVLS